MKKRLLLIILIIVIITTIILFSINKKDCEFCNIKNYKKENEIRYKNYKQKYFNLKKEKIVLYVNMGLDKPFYTNVKIIKKINFYTLVNKYNKLPDNYELKNPYKLDSSYTTKDIYVNSVMVRDLYKMIDDMKKEQLFIYVTSGYRTKEYQSNLFNNYVKKDGITNALKYSAKPRHSEHELGIAVDFITKNTTLNSFYFTKEFAWLKYNCYKYGFILRYPKDKEHITGYSYESWHYRYVGKNIAKKIKEKNITYDEYYENYLK